MLPRIRCLREHRFTIVEPAAHAVTLEGVQSPKQYVLHFPQAPGQALSKRSLLQRVLIVIAMACIVLGLAADLLEPNAFGMLCASVIVLTLAFSVRLSLRTRRSETAQKAQTGLLTLTEKSLIRQSPFTSIEDELIDFTQPFGVTLMCSARSARSASDDAWLGITTGARVSLLRTERTAFRDEHACSVEQTFERTAAALSESDARDLLAELRRRQVNALRTMVLTDALGARVVLAGPVLHVGNEQFDLQLPYESKRFAFLERVGRVDGLYDAAWLRQGALEVVLVSSMGDDGSAFPAAPPPPRNLRHAVDRVFFEPLLAALERERRNEGGSRN
jgi:hypothetical protein